MSYAFASRFSQGRRYRPLAERFWSCVEKTLGGCWLWLGALDDNGYGVISGTRYDGKKIQIPAHRLSFEMHAESPPGDRFVCHTCDNPRCVNPSHLFLGTPGENSRDAVAKGRFIRGERSSQAKLSDDSVRMIRKARVAGSTYLELADRFSVSRAAIWQVLRGNNWKHVGG